MPQPLTLSTCESAVIACLLVYPSAVGWAGTNFNPLMFSAPNRVIFQAAQKVFASGGNGGVSEVVGVMQGDGTIAEAGGMTRIHELEMAAVPPVLLPEYAKALRDELARKRLAQLLDSLGDALTNRSSSVGDVLAQGLETLENIADDRNEHDAPTLKKLLGEAVNNIQDRATGVSNGISTGVPCLDRLTGGVRPGSQWVIAGPAKGGKSSLALTLLASLAVKHGKRCALFGLEMPSVETVERLICHDGRIPATATRDGKLNDRLIASLHGSVQRLAGAPIHFRDDLFELAEIVSACRQLKSSFPDLFAVFVDYAQLVGAAVKGENREREVASVSRGLRKLSMQAGLAVVLLSQTNDDGRLRESRTLGMDATKVVTIDFGDSPHTRKLKLTQRDGMSGVEVDVAYNGDFFEFADLTNTKQP